jgi:hypothetical protein
MSHVSSIPALVACLVFVILPILPVRADLVVSSEEGARIVFDPVAEAPAPSAALSTDASGTMRVGAFLSGEEWWEIPIGAAFMVAAGYTIYYFAYQNPG